jgi:hypothetical protein
MSDPATLLVELDTTEMQHQIGGSPFVLPVPFWVPFLKQPTYFGQEQPGNEMFSFGP